MHSSETGRPGLSFLITPEIETMILPLSFRKTTRRFTLAVAVLASALRAQPTESATSDVIVLSPFEVQAEKDVGFVATSSLAGGRLAGDLKTTPAAYSVQTREFIDALQLTSLAEAAEWTVNSTTRKDEGRNELFGAATQVTMRGVSANGVQRNFFPLDVNYDSYNLDRFDYARGPNSVLFGYGSFGGTPNIVTKQAMTGKNFGTVSATAASWNYYRTTIDVNRVIAPGAAVRINALWQDADGWRDFESEKKKAVDLAGVLRWKKTTFRGEAEIGKIERNNPLFALTDQFTGWDGKTTYSSLLSTSPASNTGTTRLSALNVPTIVYYSGFNATSALNFAGTARTFAGGGATPLGGQLVPGAGNIVGSGVPWNQQDSLPDSIFALAEANSSFRLPGRGFAISTRIPTAIHDYKVYTGTIDQQVGDHLFLQVAGNYSDSEIATNYLNQRGLSDTYIDINKNMPDESANPMFLRPYNQGGRVRARFTGEQSDARVAAAYVLNNTKWGNFSVNAMAGKVWREEQVKVENYAAKISANPLDWQSSTVLYRYYWGETVRPVPDLTDVAFVDPSTGQSRSVPVGWIIATQRPNDVQKTNRELTYAQAAFKADVFKNRIHLLAAVRNDQNWQKTAVGEAQRDYPSDWDGASLYRAPADPVDYFDLSYVPKSASGLPTGPAVPAVTRPRDSSSVALSQYANDRFQDDYSPPEVDVKVTTYSTGAVVDVLPWMSVVGNYGTSYNPNTAKQRMTGTLVPPQESTGVDAALRFSFWKGRVNASVGYYQGEDKNQAFDNNTVVGAVNNILTANAIGDQSAGGINKRGVTPLPSLLQDVFDRETQGYELEVVANLSRSWRLTLNGAAPKAYQVNYSPDSRAYLDANDAVLRSVLADAGVLISSTTNVATVDNSVPAAQRSPDRDLAASGWNTLQSVKANYVTGRQLLPRLSKYTANIFTDYTFREGVLKNLRLGAGVNYRGKQVIGFKGADTVVNPANPSSTIDDPSVGPYDAVYSDDYFLVTAVLGYECKLRSKQTLKFDFNVSNLLDEEMPIYYATVLRPRNGDLTTPARVATPANFYNLAPKRYSLTVRLTF